MKYLFIILFLFIPELIIAQQDSIISINLRIGDSISVDEKQYFGLFPKIIGYQSAKLFYNKSENIYYFNIQTSNKIEKMIVSDTLVAEFKNFIEKYEELINQNRDNEIKINPILKKYLVKVPVYYKTKVKKPTISLLDGEILKWYVVYHNDSCMVISPTNYVNNFRSIKRNFRIINYNEIDTMTFLEYPIIKGKKLIFDLNFNSLDSLSMFYNVDSIIAPELKSFLETKRVYPLIWDTLDFDFDGIYYKRNFISAYYSNSAYFNNAFLAFYTSFIDPPKLNSIIILKSNYSIGFEYGYSFNNKLSLKSGFSYYQYTLHQSIFNTNQISKEYFNSYSLKLDFMYNFFHTSNYKIQNLQIYLDFLLGVNLSKINYNFNLDMKYQGENDLQYYHKNDISNSILYNYKSGIVLTTKINDLSLIQLKGYLNYNDFSGYIYTQTNYISSYIKSIFSYGFDLGIAINF